MINSKYFRVPKKKEPLQENEVHVTSRQEPINFLRYAIFLFEKRNLPYIKFKASGSAIASLVNISEILKKVIPGIHQVNRVYTLKYEQDYEPKEKGLNHVTIVRSVPILEISFYKVLPDDDYVNDLGYQPALSNEVFERVKINVASLIRRRTQMSRNYYQPRIFRGRYKAGFRGGRGHGRGGYKGERNDNTDYNHNNKEGDNLEKTEGAYRGMKAGFRGNRGYRGFRGGYKSYNSEVNSNISGRGRGFGKYHSKFDLDTQQ